jgi:hypothetical protein
MYSKHFTIARGVHGRIDFTTPCGRLSSAKVDASTTPLREEVEERSDTGDMKRMLEEKY